jgi:hypothetical protein
MKKDTKSILKLIYLYIFSTIGLVLLVIGSVGLINLGLKSYVFTAADRDFYSAQPPVPYKLERVEEVSEATELTAEEQEAVRRWLQDYENWDQSKETQNFQKSQNHRQAAQNIALILIGLPLYLYHWRLTRRH